MRIPGAATSVTQMRIRAAGRRLPRLSPTLVDVSIVLGLAAIVVEESWPRVPADAQDSTSTLLPLLIGFATVIPLLWRRRAPVPVVIAVTATAFATAVLFRTESSATFFAFLLAVFSAGAHSRSLEASLAGLGAIVFFLVVMAWTEGEIQPWSILMGAMMTGTWIAGETLRRRAVLTADLQARAAQLERERDEEAQRAVAEERVRIARELHDVVAHSVSVMVVQAAAARRIMDSRPDAARESMESIESTGRQALAEMRRLLGVLRSGDEEALARAPQPTLDYLPRLIEDIREAGLPVEVRVEGEPRPLPPGVDLSAYRVVQEALTNALRHAGPARASVVVRYGQDDVEIEVTDDGRGVPEDAGAAGGPGHGLVGMRERVALFRGEFQAGPGDGGGFAVRARLPVEPNQA